MRNTLVSVIIPTYREDKLLVEAVDSALAQTFRDFEIIVVEDGSHTAAHALREYGSTIRYIWQENQGVSGARNTGIGHAASPWLAFLDHDDLWKPEKLEQQLLLAEREPDFAVIHSDHFTLRDHGMIPGPRLVHQTNVPSGKVGKELFKNNFLILSSALVRKDACVEAGGFVRQHTYAQDYDLWLRMSRRFEFGFVNQRLTVYRDHESLSSDHPAALVDCAEVLADFVRANPNVRDEFGDDVIRQRMFDVYWEAAYAYFGKNEFSLARSLFNAAWRWSPDRPRALMYSLACLTGAPGVQVARALKRAAH